MRSLGRRSRPARAHVSGTMTTRLRRVKPCRSKEAAEVAAVVQDYRRADERAKAAGFGGVEIHAANGYLI